MNKLKKEKENKKTKNRKTVWLLSLSLLLSLFIAKVIVANSTVNSGQMVAKIEEKIANLEKENQLVSQEISSSTAISVIKEKAISLGLLETSSYYYVFPKSVAIKR